MNLPKNIFKAYDIRGIYNQELTNESVKSIAMALCDIYKENNDQIVIGRDGRLSSKTLSSTLIQSFLDNGKRVIDIGQVPTPILYFAVNYFGLNSGIIITGSHNPKNYNGLKIIMDGHALAGEEIQEIYNRIKLNNFIKNNAKKNINLENIKIDSFYVEELLKDIKINKKLKVALDAGNGAAGPVALEAYKKAGLDIIDLYCNVDGNFPNHHPNPSNPKNLEDLISCVKENKCDIGIAFDGDGDRCLVIDNLGEVLWPDKQMMIYAKDILSINKSEKIVYDVKSSKDLANIIKEYGGIPVMCRTGHSYIKMKMKEINAILGGEMSGHIFFKDRWFGFDDGIYAGIRMLEIISNSNKTSSEIFNELPKSYSTPELNITVNKDGFQHEFMKKFASEANFKDAKISKIDGVRADFANGWGILRASNTTPCLVMRFEAKSEKMLKNIKDAFINEIFKIDPALEIPDEAK
tara:strand:+ start:747 stop:2141 length:1395 start_codon:yes stop_codon:yes gene_type:complete